MGLEAICRCTIGDVAADAKVLLEATEIILRSPFRRTFQIANLIDIEVVGAELRFNVDGSAVSLKLGDMVASKWAKRITSPAPTLPKKLGIGHASPVFVIGDVTDPVLIEALDDHTADPSSAKLSLAVVNDARELDAAVKAHEAALGLAAIWIVHGKGPFATFGEMPARQLMRERGYRDTKVSAVSATLSATRYAPGS